MFKIIPVLDLLNSTVVHAKKGERSKYKPLESEFISSSNIFEIIAIFKKMFEFDTFYIADLDAITKLKPNFKILSDIYKIKNTQYLIDPGIRNSKDIDLFKRYGLKNIIVGLETIENYEQILYAREKYGENNFFLSIDLYHGLIISRDQTLSQKPLLYLLEPLKKIKIKQVILLDLYRVGQKIGGIPHPYLTFRSNFNGTIYVGGGIRNIEDILLYKNKKFNGVLVGTSLYDGTIKPNDIKNFIY